MQLAMVQETAESWNIKIRIRIASIEKNKENELFNV